MRSSDLSILTQGVACYTLSSTRFFSCPWKWMLTHVQYVWYFWKNCLKDVVTILLVKTLRETTVRNNWEIRECQSSFSFILIISLFFEVLLEGFARFFDCFWSHSLYLQKTAFRHLSLVLDWLYESAQIRLGICLQFSFCVTSRFNYLNFLSLLMEEA